MSGSKHTAKSNCPVTYALEIFGDRWTLLVLRDILLESRHTYRDILDAHPGMATNVLADRLRRLLRRDLISKERDEHDARQFIYKPTELSVSVIPMLVEMIVWGSKHGDASADPDLLRRFDDDRVRVIEEIQDRVRMLIQSQ